MSAVKTRNFDYSVGILSAQQWIITFVSFSNSQYVGQDYYDVCGTQDPYPFHNLQRIEKGKHAGNFYLLKYAGIDASGNWIVYDKDGDLIKADQATDEDRQVVGNGLYRINDTQFPL